MTRYAVTTAPLETVLRYLPGNYTAAEQAPGHVVITGNDLAGWTLDGYVIPRLASGLHAARLASACYACGHYHPTSLTEQPCVEVCGPCADEAVAP